VRTTIEDGESVLVRGPHHISYEGIRVSFDAPGPRWEWWDPGMGLRRSAAEPDDYGAVIFFLVRPSARIAPCSAAKQKALGDDPDALLTNVSPLLDLAHARVVQQPRVVTAFGGEAVHLRLMTDGLCPSQAGLPVQVRGDTPEEPIDPGWGGQRALDLWHVVLPGTPAGSMLVASWDLNGTDAHLAQRDSLVDSLRVSAG
jgi:hypothetical protein